MVTARKNILLKISPLSSCLAIPGMQEQADPATAGQVKLFCMEGCSCCVRRDRSVSAYNASFTCICQGGELWSELNSHKPGSFWLHKPTAKCMTLTRNSAKSWKYKVSHFCSLGCIEEEAWYNKTATHSCMQKHSILCLPLPWFLWVLGFFLFADQNATSDGSAE